MGLIPPIETPPQYYTGNSMAARSRLLKPSRVSVTPLNMLRKDTPGPRVEMVRRAAAGSSSGFHAGGRVQSPVNQ